MKSFKEWLEEKYPEDEIVNEFLGSLKDGVGKSVRAGLAAGALALGSGHGDAGAAMPMVPKVTQDEGNYSSKPFNRDVGPMPLNAEEMDDFDLYHWQWRHISKMENEMMRHRMAARIGAHAGHKEWPMWYIKYGTYYGWKMPKPPRHPAEPLEVRK